MTRETRVLWLFLRPCSGEHPFSTEHGISTEMKYNFGPCPMDGMVVVLAKEAAEDFVEVICGAAAAIYDACSTGSQARAKQTKSSCGVSGAWAKASVTQSMDWRPGPGCKKIQYFTKRITVQTCGSNHGCHRFAHHGGCLLMKPGNE